MAILEAGRKNIVVLGAGFGGITALLNLYRRMKRENLFPRFNLVLVSKTSHHLYTPALYEIASIPKGEADIVCLNTAICVQVEDIIGRFPEIRFLGETVSGLDPHSRLITFASENQIAFEYAVVALGSETNFFNIPGLEETAYPVKTFEDAVRLRNRVEELIRKAPERLRIIVGGAGATGVELSAEFVNYLCYLKERIRQGKCQEEITLLEAAPEILPGFSPGVIARTKRRLKKLSVRILTDAVVEKVSPTTIQLKDDRNLPYDILVWSGGVKPARVLKNFGLVLDKKGGIVVNEFLQAKMQQSVATREPRVYAVGDNASFTHPKTKKPLPGNVPVAESEAHAAARNTVAAITGEPPHPFRPLASYPFILAVGGKYAVTDLVIVKFFGLLGWMLKQVVELRYLLFILPAGRAIRMWLRTVYYSTVND